MEFGIHGFICILSILTLNRSLKNGLQAERTTLCAWSRCPSQAIVTSVKSSSSRKVSNWDVIFAWKLFHLKQNCWSSAITPPNSPYFTRKLIYCARSRKVNREKMCKRQHLRYKNKLPFNFNQYCIYFFWPTKKKKFPCYLFLIKLISVFFKFYC